MIEQESVPRILRPSHAHMLEESAYDSHAVLLGPLSTPRLSQRLTNPRVSERNPVEFCPGGRPDGPEAVHDDVPEGRDVNRLVEGWRGRKEVWKMMIETTEGLSAVERDG